MKRWLGRIGKSVVVLVGVIMLTSFTIDATDALNDSQSALSIFAKKIADTSCPKDMVEVSLAERTYCIDSFENSFSGECPFVRPNSTFDTQKNVNEVDCQTLSLGGQMPAVYVTFHQAQNFCARRGARLPTGEEWYSAALGTPDSAVCNIAGSLSSAGKHEACVSARGVYDMIGNAWEWVDAEVRSGDFEGRQLPETGYVAEADRDGVAVATTGQPNELFNSDYFWSEQEGSVVMMRGGFYGSGSDGGVYSVHADIEPSFSSVAAGFRCVIDL